MYRYDGSGFDSQRIAHEGDVDYLLSNYVSFRIDGTLYRSERNQEGKEDGMTAEVPNVTETGRYSVTKTTEVLGIHRNTLNRYTERGLIKCGHRRESGRKFYEGREILRFWKARM